MPANPCQWPHHHLPFLHGCPSCMDAWSSVTQTCSSPNTMLAHLCTWCCLPGKASFLPHLESSHSSSQVLLKGYVFSKAFPLQSQDKCHTSSLCPHSWHSTWYSTCAALLVSHTKVCIRQVGARLTQSLHRPDA